MKIKAKVSFCGLICMAKGEEREIPEGDVLRDLLRAGYVISAEPKSKGEKKK